ncbi:MAG: hypothetical protein ACI4ES_04250 [Roseburia sp.]
MKKIFLCLLTCLSVVMSTTGVYADVLTGEEENDVVATEAEPIKCSFSEPVIEKKDGSIVYRTTLSVDNIENIEGYQIKVQSKDEKSVSIENKAGGMATENVYKDDAENLAVISSEITEKGSEICEIAINYAYTDFEKDRMLTVSDLQIVKSVSEENIQAGGPYTLELPYVNPPFYADYRFYLIAGVTVAIATIVICIYRKRKRTK